MTDENGQVLEGMRSLTDLSKENPMHLAGKVKTWLIDYDWVFGTKLEKIIVAFCVLFTAGSFIKWIFNLFIL